MPEAGGGAAGAEAASPPPRGHEGQLRQIADALPVLIAYLDAGQRYRFVNAAYERWFGLARQEILGRRIRDLMGDRYEDSRPHIEKALAGATVAYEKRIVHPDFGPRILSSTYIPHLGPDGACVGLYALIADVTDRRQAEDAARAREEELRVLTDALPVLIAYIDAAERYRFVNATYADWFGRPIAEIVGRQVRAVIGEEGYAAGLPILRRALSGEAAEYERAIDTPAHGRREIHVTCVPHRLPDGAVAGCYLLAVDITERKQRDAALRASEEKLRLAVETTGLGLWDYDIVTGALVWSDRLKALYGLPPEAAIDFGRYVAGLHPEDRDRVLETYRRALDPAGDGRFSFEHRTVAPDGAVRWIQAAGRVVFDAGRRPVRVIGTAQDITARRFSEEALRASHARTEEILESIDDAFFALDREWRFTYVNRHCERLWGRSREALLGKVMWEAFPQLLDTEPYRAYLLAAAERRPVRIETVAVTIGRPIDLSIYPSPSGLSVYFRDISERRQGEERQRLLMAELDHRVKNTLATIQSMAARTAVGKRTKEDFAAALQGRIAAMARAQSLLTQSRWEGAGLRRIVLEELGPYGADRVAVAGEDLLLTPKAATAISMVVHELTTNSAKYGALSVPGGRIEISWQAADGPEARLLRLDWSESGGPPVRPPEQRGFGSTLIEQTLRYEFGGATRLDFRPNGVRCAIEAPLDRIAVAAPAQPPAPPAEPAEARRRVRDLSGMRILVVEDSMLVALDLESSLAAAGVTVVGPATTLAQALRLAESESLDAAVLDVNLDGEQVYPAAGLLLRRGIPFIFSTGYDSRSALPEPFRRFRAVQKPFTGEGLLQALRQALADGE